MPIDPVCGMTVDEQTAPATAVQQQAAQAVAEGVRAYLLKPFDATQLEQVVEQCFGPAA